MTNSILGLKVGDYILWKGPDSDSSELIGKVVRIHQNRLGKEVKEKLGIPISSEPYAVIELENGILTDLDGEGEFERVEVH